MTRIDPGTQQHQGMLDDWGSKSFSPQRLSWKSPLAATPAEVTDLENRQNAKQTVQHFAPSLETPLVRSPRTEPCETWTWVAFFATTHRMSQLLDRGFIRSVAHTKKNTRAPGSDSPPVGKQGPMNSRNHRQWVPFRNSYVPPVRGLCHSIISLPCDAPYSVGLEHCSAIPTIR